MFRFILASLILVSCHSRPAHDEEVISKELQDAITKNDTALAKQIAKKESGNIRTAVTDSSFAALMDANLAIQEFEFRIGKARSASKSKIIPDSLILNKESDAQLYAYVYSVNQFVLQRAVNQHDITYYKAKMSIPFESWINNNFRSKTIEELQISALTIQKDLAIASAIINNVDSKEIRDQTEDLYNNLIKNLRKDQ